MTDGVKNCIIKLSTSSFMPYCTFCLCFVVCMCLRASPAVWCWWWSVWGRGLCVWLSSGDAELISGPAEPCQYSVWWLGLAGPSVLSEASGIEHHAEPVQRSGHTAALPLLRPPVQLGAAGKSRHCAPCARSLGPLRAVSPHRWEHVNLYILRTIALLQVKEINTSTAHVLRDFSTFYIITWTTNKTSSIT